MKPNSKIIKSFFLIFLLLLFSYSKVFSQEIVNFNSPWEVQTHLKHLNYNKMFSDLEIFLKNNYSDSSLNLETRLYMTDDLANLYATKLINFKKADEFNKQAQDLYSSLIGSDLKTLPFSNYFNENRLTPDLFYSSPDALKKDKKNEDANTSSSWSDPLFISLESRTLAERKDLVTELPQEMIEFVRREDLLATGDRIQRRKSLLQKNLGVQSIVAQNTALKNTNLLKNIETEDQANTLSEKKKNYLLAKYHWSSVSPGSHPDQYLPVIQFGEKAISQLEETNMEGLVLLCQLHRWVGMSNLKTGQTEPGIAHLNKFDQAIEKLDQMALQEHQDQKTFINDTETKIKAELREDQLSDQKWLDFWKGTKNFGSKLLEGIGQAAIIGAMGVVAYADGYNAAYGGQRMSAQDWQNFTDLSMKASSSVTESSAEVRQDIENTYQSDVASLQTKYFEAERNIEDSFFLQRNSLSPQQLKYARFMGPNEQLDFFVAKGDGLFESGGASDAKGLYMNALGLIEKQRATIDSDTKRIVFSGHRNSIYVKLIRIFSQENDAKQAFHLIERSKGRVFADLLESKDLQLARNEESDFYQSYLLKNSEMNEILSHGSISLDQIKYLEENRGIQVSSKFRTTPLIEFNNLDQAKPITLEETENILARPTIDSNFVQYFVSPEKTIIILAGGTPEIREVPVGKEELIKKISRFRELISKGSEDQSDLLSLSQDLYETLIKPIAFGISKKRIIISPHGPLHYLPFQLLHDGEKYLLEDYTLNYIPSATVLRYLADKPPIGPLEPEGEPEFIGSVADDSSYLPGWGTEGSYEHSDSKPPKSILLLGNPELDSDALNLPYSEVEIDNAALFFPDALKLLHDEASETNVKEKASSYEVLHFATHATFDNDDPFNSSLLLASDGINDGKLTVEEIYQLKLKPSLVVLSACETGLGKYSAGDEIIGFYRAFMYAGAQSIIATLWPIADEASSFLINEFYQSFKKNSLGESLRMAQLKTKEQYPNPVNWAGFVLVGRN
ncbi:MAG TPA: CHAT domain-containing protein [Nitrospina sp.]|nr:CHAT domain-containing protein [Nitrospina sp.]